MNDRISVKFNGPFMGPNGYIDYVPPYLLTNGARASCHKHEEPVLFRTLKDLQIHNKSQHRL